MDSIFSANEASETISIKQSGHTTLKAICNNNTNNTTSDMSEVLLLCIDVDISHPNNPEDKYKSNAFFDSGSTRKYIHQDPADELQLFNFGTQRLQMNTFGSVEPKSFLTGQVSIRLHKSDGSYITLRRSTMKDRTCSMKYVSIHKFNLMKQINRQKLPTFLANHRLSLDLIISGN